jgi:hypothetical protein
MVDCDQHGHVRVTACAFMNNKGNEVSMFGIVFLGVFCSLVLALAVYSFYRAQYIRDCVLDEKDDWRFPFGIVGLLFLLTPFTMGIGLLVLLSILIGTVPGVIYRPLKMKRYWWSKRPKALSSAEHKQADKLADEVNNLILNVARPYRQSKVATEAGLNKLVAPARLIAREYLALTGLNIENEIDLWMTIEALRSDSKEGEIQA